ncbi:MAG: PLP-dependent lyase/thiolase [Oscillospiraceae bacterium]|nr:PLP-dependent lyase/thiolase [Oscillospiraceae bacterium]
MYCASTPLLALPQSERIICKLEGANPSGSLKDRAVFPMIAGEDSRLPLLTADWGPFALSTAWAGKLLGRQVHCLLPEDAPAVFVEKIHALGAQIHMERGSLQELRQRAARAEDVQLLDSSCDPEYAMAFCEGLAEELWSQCSGSIAALVCGTESCGCLMGCATGLKMKNPDIWAVAAPLSQDRYGSCDPLGTTDPEFYVPQLCDLLSYCSLQQARQQQKWFREQSGISCGIIGGAALQAAKDLEKELPPDKGSIVVILPSCYDCY